MKSIIIIQVVVAYFSGLISLFMLYRGMNSFLKRKIGLDEPNNSFAVFQVGILLSGSVILSSILSAAVNAIQFLNQGNNFETNSFFISLAYVLVFLLIGLAFTVILIASSVFIFFQLTKINEWEQIKNNNIPTALISAALILGMSLIVDDYVGHLCEALIPYPSVLQIR